jgi:lipopolysaccharide transport system ATP-binding protein
MSRPIIEVKGVSKKYRLGKLGMTSFREEFTRVFDRLRGNSAALPGQAEASSTDFWALQDVSFDVEPGQVIGVIGRNGAGKSTLLKILSRITEPTLGEIKIKGRLASLLEVGTGFHPELSGRDNIYLNGAILGMRKSEIARKFDEIVEFSEIGKFIDTPVKRYSSGMYVRLAFAVAAHLEPEILVIDEVLAVGDAAFQQKCLGKMQNVASSEGRTILFVSHHMAAMRRLCQSCVVMEKGRNVGVMPVDKAIDYYSTMAGSSSTDVDVSSRKRDWGTEGSVCRILRVNVVSKGGLRFNEPFAVEVTVQAEKHLEQMMLGFAFNTVEGQRILTLDTDNTGQTFTLDRGVTTLRLSIDRLPLHPSRFYVSSALGTGKHFFDIIDSFALWEVHSGANDFESDRSFGGCRIQPQIEIEPAGVTV